MPTPRTPNATARVETVIVTRQPAHGGMTCYRGPGLEPRGYEGGFRELCDVMGASGYWFACVDPTDPADGYGTLPRLMFQHFAAED